MINNLKSTLSVLEEEASAAQVALMSELALGADQQRHHGKPANIEALRRANTGAMAAWRARKDEIEAAEAALPHALDRERIETAEKVASAETAERNRKIAALDKRRVEVIREANFLVQNMDNLHIAPRLTMLARRARGARC